MADTRRHNLLSDKEIENEHYSSTGRKQKRHVHRGKKKLHRRRKSKKKTSISTEISYSFPSLNDTYERLKKIDKLVNNTEITRSSDSLESSTSVHQTDNENSNDEFETLESSQLPQETMNENSNDASATYESSTLNHQTNREDLDEGAWTSKSSILHHQTKQEYSNQCFEISESSTLQHQTSSKNSSSSSNIFEVGLDDIIENDKELDESFSVIEETTTLYSHLPNKSVESSATTVSTSPNVDNASSSSEDFSLGDEETFLPSEYQVDIIQQLVTLTEYPPTKQKMLKDQAFKRSEEHIFPLDSKEKIIKNVDGNEEPHAVHHAKVVEYKKVDSTEPDSSFDNSDYENVDDEDYIDIQLPFEKPHRKNNEKFVEKREPSTESDKSDRKNKNQHLLSKIKFDRRFNRRRLFATSTAFWRGFKWPEFEESFDSIIRDSDKLLQKDVTSTNPSTEADYLWAAMFTTSAAEGDTVTENEAPYEKMEPNDKNIIENPNLYSDILESSTFEGFESRKQIENYLVNINEISAVSDIESSHSVAVNVPEVTSISHSKPTASSEYESSKNKVATEAKVETGKIVADYSKKTKGFLSFSWPDHIQYTTSSPVEMTSDAVKKENKSEESTTKGYTSVKLPTNTNEVLNQSSNKTMNYSVSERPRTRMQKVKEKAKFWKNFIWPDHQTHTTPKIIGSSSEAVNFTKINEQVAESELQTTSQKITITEKEERPTKIIGGTNYSPQLTSRSYNTEKLEHEGLISSAEQGKTEESTSSSAKKENVKKNFLFHLRGKSNKISGTERKPFKLPFQWPSDEVFENETSEKPISISGSEGGKNKTKISDESLSVLTNFEWPDREKFDFASANMPLPEQITSELPNIRKLFTTSSHTGSKPRESTRNFWGQFQWPEHESFTYRYIGTENQKGTPPSTSEKWSSEEWGFSFDQDVKNILEETEKKTLLLHEGTQYPSKLTLSPTESTTRGERIELVEDIADFKDLSGKLEEVTIKEPMKVSAKQKVNAQVTESEDDEGLWKFRVLEPGEAIKYHKETRKPFFEFPTIYSFKPIGTPIDEWLQFNEDLQERTITEPTVSKRTKSTFFIWKTEPITSTESTEFDEDIFEEYSTLIPLDRASETTELFNLKTTSESSTSEEYTIPEIITTRKPTFTSEIYDYLSQTQGVALKFNVSSFIKNFMRKFTVKMRNTAVESSQTPTISKEADGEKQLGSIQSIIENIALSTISGEEKLGSSRRIIENIVPSAIRAQVEEEKLSSTEIIFENIVRSTISEVVEEEKLGSTESMIENIVSSTMREQGEGEKLGSTQIIIENTVPSTISEKVEEEKLGSTPINIENIVPSTISEEVEEGELGSTQRIIENINPSTIIKQFEEEKLGSTPIIFENVVPSKISEGVAEEVLGSTQSIIENIFPSIISERVEEEKLGITQISIENIVPSTISEEVEKEKLPSTRTIMENIISSKYVSQEIEDHRASPSSSGQTTVYKTSSTPMTPAEPYSQRLGGITESSVIYKTEELEIEKTLENLILDQISKGIESEYVNKERTSATWLFETNYPQYSRGQSDEYYMNEMKKTEEYEMNQEFLPQKTFQTTEEYVFPAEAQSALTENMQRFRKPVISIESELGTTIRYFQELKGFDEHFRPAESTKISFEEESTKPPYENIFGTKQVKQPPKFTLLEENGHIESKIVEKVTIGGEIPTNEQESEILGESFTEINAELYSELLKLTESEIKDEWKYDLNLPRSSEEISEGNYFTEIIRTPAVQENLHLKMIHLPYEAFTSHTEQLGNELDHDVLHITQKKTEETHKGDMEIKEEYENNMNHLPENLSQETSTICQICDEKSYKAGLEIGENSKTPKLTSRKYELIPVNYNQKGIEINRPVPTKKDNVFTFNQKPTTISPSSTFTELKVQPLREQGKTKKVQKVTIEKINAEADKTEITSLKEYMISSSTVTEEGSESIGEKNDKFSTEQWKEIEFLNIMKSGTNTESVYSENIPVNEEEHETFPTEYYSTEKTKYQVDIENTKVQNTLSSTEYPKLDMVGENLSTYVENVFGSETLSVGKKILPKTQMTSTSVLSENTEAFEKSVKSHYEALGEKTTNYEFTPISSKDNVQTMREGFLSTKLNEYQFATKNLNDFKHSLTPNINITSKSTTTIMKDREKDKLRTTKKTLAENHLIPTEPTEKKEKESTEKREEHENNMLHLPENKQKETSTLCEICDTPAEYAVSVGKSHKSTKPYETTDIEFKIEETNPGPYHFKGIKINRPLPTESHTILPFKIYSTSYSEQQESNTASKGEYHPQSLITKARTGTPSAETNINVSQEVSTTAEDKTAPKKSYSKKVNPVELITTSEGNMFSMETLFNESAQYLTETSNENTTPVKTFSVVEVPQPPQEEHTISTETFSPVEESTTSSEIFSYGKEFQGLFTAPEEIFSETFSTGRGVPEFFTTPEENTATFMNEYSSEEFVTMVPINISSVETFASEENLQEFITKAEGGAASIEIFPVEEKQQELITKRVENTASLETFSKEKILQELVPTPQKTTGSFPNEYSLKELVNTTNMYTASEERISSEKNTQERITFEMKNTVPIEILPQEKNAQESITSKEKNISSSRIFPEQTISQELRSTPERITVSPVNEYNLEEFINATEINTASVETTSSAKNTKQYIAIEKENTASIEIFPHGKSTQETITARNENTFHLRTYSKETFSEEFVTTPEKNATSIVDEYSIKGLVNIAEMSTSSFSSEKNTRKFLTIEHENISFEEIFPNRKNLQELITTKEENTTSSQIFSEGQVPQELIYTSLGSTASIMHNYNLKELVNTTEINTVPMMSISNEKNTPEFLSIGKENFATVEIFPHEKNLQELIATKEKNTASSEIFSEGQISQERSYTTEENTASIMDKYSLKELVNTADIRTAPLMSISSERNTQELITLENENIASIEIFPNQKHLQELITTKGQNTAYSEIFSKENISQEMYTTAEGNTEFITDKYSLENLVNTSEINTVFLESISSEKSTQEVITIEKQNTVSIETSPLEKSVPELITSEEESTVSSETSSGEKLLQEFITTPKVHTSFVIGYSLKEIANTEEIETAPIESISTEKITQELIIIGKENTTPAGIFQHEKDLYELITSEEGSTAETFSGEKLLQELIITPKNRNISLVNEYSLKEFVNTAEMNTASMGPVSSEKNIEDLITEKGKTASIEILPHEKNIHELITSREGSTVFVENLSNWKILQESATTSNRNITFVKEYRPQDFITTAEMKTASIRTLPSQKNTHGLFTTINVNISSIEEFLVRNITEEFNITSHASTVAMKMFPNGKELEEFIITTERNIGSTEELSKQNAPQEKFTSANSFTASIEPFSIEIITTARMPNEETPPEFNAPSRINTAFMERTLSQKTKTATIRSELYGTESIRQSENPIITERTFASGSSNFRTTEKNLNTNKKNLNRINNEHIGSEISTKNLDETKTFITSLTKKSTTENEGKTSNLVKKEWQNEMEDEFEMLHLPHVDRYETSTICEICSESEDVQISTIQVLQTKEQTSENFQLLPETLSVRTNKDEFGEIMSTKKIEREEEYESNMLNLPKNEQAETSTLCEICDEETQYEHVGHISSKKTDFRLELATSMFGTSEINQASIYPYRFTGIEINRPIPTQNLNIVPFKMYSSPFPKSGNANTPKMKYTTTSTEDLSKQTVTPLSISEELYETEHGEQSETPAKTIQEDINIKPVIFSTLNEEEVVTKFHSKKKLSTITEEYIGSFITENLDTDTYLSMNTNVEKESNDDYEMLHLPRMDQHETSTICEICLEVEDVQTPKPQLFTAEKLSKPKSFSSTESVSEHIDEEKASTENFDYVEESNMLKLPEIRKDETSTLCEICDEEEQEAITGTDGIGRIIINRPIPTQNMNIRPFNEQSTMYNVFTKSEEEFLFQNLLTSSTQANNLMEPLETITSESVSGILEETGIINQSKQPYPGIASIYPGVLEELESSVISQPSSPKEFASLFEAMEINLDSTLHTQASPEELKGFTEDLLTKVLDETEFSRLSLLSSLKEFTPQFEVEGKAETIFENAESEEVTPESVDEILHADESVYHSKQSYHEITILPSDLMEDLNVHIEATSEELKDEPSEDLLTKVLDETEFPGISLPSSLTQFEVEGEAETIYQNAKPEEVTLGIDDEIFHADETNDHSKQSYNGITILPTDLMEDLNVHIEATSEELKEEPTEDLLTKVLDETEFPGISPPSSLTQFEVEGEAETIYQNIKPEEVTLGVGDEILHADETVDHSKQSYNGITILPTDLMEDLSVHTEATSEELKDEATEDLLTEVLDQTEFPGISLPSSLNELTSQFEVEGKAEQMFQNAKPEHVTSESVEEILHESEIVNPSKPYSGIEFLPSDLMGIRADSNLYTQASSEEVKVEFTEDLLTKVLDETEFPQITTSPSLEEIVAQLQTVEAEKILRNTSKNHFPNEPLRDFQLDQYETTTIPHFDHILRTFPSSTTEEGLETSTKSTGITTSHELNEQEYTQVHFPLNTEYIKTVSIPTSKQDNQEDLLSSSTIHTKKPGMHRPITYKFEGIKINRPVPTENTNIILFKMLPATEPRLCKIGEEEFPHQKYIWSTHKSTPLLEFSSVKNRTSEMKEPHETGIISEIGTGSETQNEILIITEQTSATSRAISPENTPNYSEGYIFLPTELNVSNEINVTNFELVNVEHGMKEQSSTSYSLKSSEDISGVRKNTISAYESSTLELTSGTVPVKVEEAMAETEKEVSEKSETYVPLPLKSDETASMQSLLLEHNTSELTKHDKHVPIEEMFEERFRETQEAYTQSVMKEGVALDKDITNFFEAQSTLGVSETIENEIEEQHLEENFPGSTLLTQEKKTEVISSREQFFIPNELNKKFESLDSVVSRIFASTYSPVQKLITVENEFQTINMETDILENELKELNVDFSEMLATTMPSDVLLERLEEIIEPSIRHQLNTEAESIVHSSHYISDHSESFSTSAESIKNTKPEISESESTEARNKTITEWSDAMVKKLLVSLISTENLTAAKESGMRKYSQEMNLTTTISATEVTVEHKNMKPEFFSVSSNNSGELYKPNVILSKEDELLLTSFPEQNSEAKFLATLIEIPSSKTSTESTSEQYEWEKKGSPSESRQITETEGKHTLYTETPMMEHEIFSQSPNVLQELYTSSAILLEKEILYTRYLTQTITEENFLATMLEESNIEISTQTALKEESMKYFSAEGLSGKTSTNIMEHEISSLSSNTLEDYALTSSLWQKGSESEPEESFLATLIEEGRAKISTKTTLKEEDMKYFSEEEATGRTITNIVNLEISPISTSTLEIVHHPITGSSQQKESETEYLTESELEESFFATLIEEGHAKVSTETTLKEQDMEYFSEEEATENTIKNIMDHEISSTSLSTLKVFHHPITGSSQQKESETEYSTESEYEESFLVTLIEEGHAKLPTKTNLKEEMRYFSVEATERTITNMLDHELSPTTSNTLIIFHHPITGSSQQKESETEYYTKLNSEEIMLATLIENETSSILTKKITEEIYRSEGTKGFSESQLVSEKKSETTKSPEEFVSSIESTIMPHSKVREDYSLHYSSSSLTERVATQTEYLSELSSEEIFLASLVENQTTELSIEDTGAALDESFLTDLKQITNEGFYNNISTEKLPAENISETNSEEVFLNTLFEEEMVNISIGNTVFSVETTVKHGETSISSSIFEESFNYSAIPTENIELQTINVTKINSEESSFATLMETEVTETLQENTSEKQDWHRKDTTSKSPGVEKISGIPLLTTLLLSLVASSTQHPDTNQISGHYKMNTQENQTFPKCLVVFFTGENASNPMISLNGTKWIPSHGPFVAEESTTSLNDSMSQMPQSTENTSPEAKSVTTELSEDDTEETETSSSVEITTEEITDTSNFIQGGCTEADFENNNNCFCMLDLTIDHVAGEFQALNSSNLNKVECSTFLKVNTGLIIKDEKSTAKRKKRSYLYLKYHNRKKREIVEYNKLDDVLANELVPSNSGGTIYSAVGASVSIPCVYKNEVVEREHFTRYVWTSQEDKAVPLSDRVRETTDGVLKISDVTVKDGGNYTCSVNRPFGTADAEHKRFRHELNIVERPIFKIKTTIMYNTEETCSLKHGDIIHNHLPKLLEELLCGLHKRVCKVEMERPNCVAMEDNTYLSFKYVVALDALPSLIPSLTYEKCDFDCQMKIYGSLISLLIKNVETINFLNIVSETKTSNHTFKPREIKFPTDRKTVEDTTLFPMLLIGCPPGFGIQQKTNKICVACPRNYYSADNSSSCVLCPFIHFQPNLGSTACLECRTPFEDKSCVGMVLANRSFLIIYIGSTVAIIFLILLCVFCAQSVGTPAKKRKNTQTPKRRRMGRRDIEDPAEKTLLLKDTGSRKVVKGPKVPPPDFY